MSRREQSSNSKIIMTVSASNDSSDRKEEVPIKTNQSLNTESYEYFSQKIVTKNNITESSAKTENQKSNTKSIKCTCNQDLSSNKKELKCICNKGSEVVQCTCNQGLGLTTGAMVQCTCGLSGQKCANILSGQKQKCICGLSEQKCKCGLSEQKCTCGLSTGDIQQNQTNVINTKTTNKYSNAIQTQTQKISTQSNINTGLKIHEEKKESSINTQAKVCNCGNIKASLQAKSKTVESKININKTTSQEEWNEICVGQKNENLQIFPKERPELLVQCVQDIKVIQEPKPVQILIPVEPYEIDYPLGLEIYGKQKKVFICPENVDNLDVSKAYSKIEPHFDNLNIGQNENVHCEKIQKKQEELSMQTENFDLKKENEKKEKYDSLELENVEMFVKGKKDFNKNNQVELTTKMNVVGKQKVPWNESNEAIKTTKMNIDKNGRTKFENLYKEQNVYNYKGKIKNKYSIEELNLESNDNINYPAEFVPTDWNKSTLPMSGKPFTLEKVQKEVDISATKGDKITIKKAYETTDWNKKNKNRKEVQINMDKKTRKAPLIKQRIQPVKIKGKENNWNDAITKENDANLQIDKTKIQKEFVLSRGDEVTISNEGEEILVNDDYNIVEENYTRPIRANIQKVQEYSEESISSEYDVLKGIQKYMGEYQYKELVKQSLKIKGPNIIINDISGKYPRRVETFHGLDENFEKLSNDQVEQQKIGGKYKVRINIQKKEINQNEYDNEQSQGNENENEYEEESDKNNVEPEDGQEPEQNEEQEQEQEEHEQEEHEQEEHEQEEHEQEEQENMDYPEDKDQNQIPHDKNQENNEVEKGNEQMGRKEQYYYLKQNEEKNDSEPKDEMEQEKEQQEDLNQNEEEEVKDTQPKEDGPKIYIKEITYTNNEQNEEKDQTNLRYITLKRKEEQEDSSSQPIDHNEEEAVPQSEKEVKVEKIEREQYITMESQKVDEQHMSKSENEIKSDLEQEIEKKEENLDKKEMEIKKENEENKEIKKEENVQNQYLTMASQKVDEQHISRDEGQPDNELDEEIKKKEINVLQSNEENKENILIEKKQEIEIQEKKEAKQEEKHEQEQVKKKIEGQLEIHMEGQGEEHEEEHVEDHFEQQGEEHEQEQVGEHEEEQVEEHEEEQGEEHEEEQVEEHEEEHNDEHEEEHIEEHAGQFEEVKEGHMEKEAKEQKKEIEDEMHNEEQKIEQKEEIHEQEKEKEIIHGDEINVETKQKPKTLSQIVANAIKAEMKEQELKNEEEVNMAKKQLIKSRADPNDSINKVASNKINIQSSQGQKVITKTLYQQQNVQTEVVINPMLYSFGQRSVENSDFSTRNENVFYMNNIQGSGLTFGQDGVFKTNYISGSGLSYGNNYGNISNINTQQQLISNYIKKSNVHSSNSGLSGKYYFSIDSSRHSNIGKGLREPMDTIKRRIKLENEMKADNENGDLAYGPRDSRKE